MEQLVIRREKVVNMYQPLLPFVYPYADLVGDINGNGNGFRWDGDVSHKITWIKINSGNDEAMNLQHLDCTIDQQWNMSEVSREITQYRKYRDILDRVYETESDVLASDVLVDYLQNKRPFNMARYVSAKLYDEAKNSGHSEMFVEASLTKDNIVDYIDAMSLAQNEKTNSLDEKILYLSFPAYGLLKKSALNDRVVMNRDNVIGRDIAYLDDMKIVPLRSEVLYSAVDTSNKYAPTEDAVQIHAIMVIKNAVAHPYGIDDIRVDAPSALSDNKQVFGNWFSFDVFEHPGYDGWGVGVIAEPASTSEVNP